VAADGVDVEAVGVDFEVDPNKEGESVGVGWKGGDVWCL
jgi:hypothetical protein